MKKNFVKPMLRSYELNKKENIVSSINILDGIMSASWTFHQYDEDNNLIDGSKGCFAYFDNIIPTNENILTSEGAWNGFIATLTRWDNSTHGEYHQPSAYSDWVNYNSCKTKQKSSS